MASDERSAVERVVTALEDLSYNTQGGLRDAFLSEIGDLRKIVRDLDRRDDDQMELLGTIRSLIRRRELDGTASRKERWAAKQIDALLSRPGSLAALADAEEPEEHLIESYEEGGSS